MLLFTYVSTMYTHAGEVEVGFLLAATAIG